jgi:DNA-binding LytR/AlgR family response regulator
MNENTATIHVASENQGESFEVKKNDLIYLQSAENYVEVYFLENGKIQKRIIRNTLKQLAKDWEGETALFRCHKSYLINLSRVLAVTGNAQGLKAQLEHVETTIPISRLLIDDLKQRMQSLKV